MIPSNYFAGCYWPAGFFGQAIGVSMAPPPTDRAIFDALADLWEPIVGDVVYGDKGPASYQGGGSYAWLLPWRWREDPDSDGQTRVRTVWFRLTIYAIADVIDDTPAAARLHDLAARCADALDLHTPSWCLANETRLGEGMIPQGGPGAEPASRSPSAPLSTAVCIGTFAYPVQAGARTAG